MSERLNQNQTPNRQEISVNGGLLKFEAELGDDGKICTIAKRETEQGQGFESTSVVGISEKPCQEVEDILNIVPEKVRDKFEEKFWPKDQEYDSIRFISETDTSDEGKSTKGAVEFVKDGKAIHVAAASWSSTNDEMGAGHYGGHPVDADAADRPSTIFSEGNDIIKAMQAFLGTTPQPEYPSFAEHMAHGNWDQFPKQ
ncbi:hypothetical protein J6T21_01910 [Candidatus Saccharibacteria bacterium]|nr:hypothetical protein [Candidatus Saccharibacteria bacterium]